ncbi:hypothetical protein HDE_04744 [Halotydeus destructor]|nr:hypothetical protein HDE_04744 [Halotydeus destructor]
MEEPDGFTGANKYVTFYPEDAHLSGINFVSSLNCKTFHSQARVEDIPEEVRHLGKVELIQERAGGWGRRKLLLFTSNNLTPDTEFSVRLYWTRAGDPNLYCHVGSCHELFFQVFDGFALAMGFLCGGLFCKENSKSVGRLIVHSPFKYYSRTRIHGEKCEVAVDKCYIKLQCHDGHVELCKQRLASHSSVFKAMFQSEFRERDAEYVNLDCVHSSVLGILLASMNEQPLNFEDEHLAKEVLIFSDMFDIPILHQATQNFLLGELRLDNVLAMMAFAKMHNAPILHDYCLRFIGRKVKLLGGIKLLICFEKITCVTNLRQLIKHCDKFKLNDFSDISRSDNGSGLNAFVGITGPPNWYGCPNRSAVRWYGNRLLLYSPCSLSSADQAI